jgi:uncharacterized membrane protein
VPDWRWLVPASLLLILLLFWSYRTARGGSASGWQRYLLMMLRLLSVAAVVICLLDPQNVVAVRHQQKVRIAVLLDTSRSMSITDTGSDRLEYAKAWIRNKFEPSILPGIMLSYHTFDGALRSLTDLDTASPTGGVTSIAGALEDLLAIPNQDPLEAVILCSDGIANSGREPEAVAATFGRRGIPIHTLTTGTTNEMRDIIVESVQVKRAVTDQSPTRIAITLRSPGCQDQTASVQIRHQDEVLVSKEVKLNGGNQQVQLDFKPHQKGFQIYEVVIPTQPNEWRADNNRRKFGLEVMDPTINVIYMEGTPGEAQYLKSALEYDPNIKCRAMYNPRQGFPNTLAELLKYDVVINSDIKKEYFTQEQLRNTVQLVEDYGGGFAMVGGFSAFGSGGYQRTIIDRITPVAMEEMVDYRSQAFQMRRTADAQSHPIMALGASKEENEIIWTKKLPRLLGYNRVDHGKPGAVVLAENPLASSTYGPLVILAVQEVGKGRTLAFTSDTTRGWGEDFETIWGEPINPNLPLNEANSDSRYYRQFWINAIRWLAAGKVGKTNNLVALEISKTQCVTNETIAASIKVLGQSLQETRDAEVSLVLSNSPTSQYTIKSSYDESAHAYQAELHLAEPGTYSICAVASLHGKPVGEDRQILDCNSVDLEMAEVRANPERMAQIARISGGRVLSGEAGEVSAIVTALQKTMPVSVEYRPSPLWDKASWLALLLFILSLEWVIRRLRGFA